MGRSSVRLLVNTGRLDIEGAPPNPFAVTFLFVNRFENHGTVNVSGAGFSTAVDTLIRNRPTAASPSTARPALAAAAGTSSTKMARLSRSWERRPPT